MVQADVVVMRQQPDELAAVLARVAAIAAALGRGETRSRPAVSCAARAASEPARLGEGRSGRPPRIGRFREGRRGTLRIAAALRNGVAAGAVEILYKIDVEQEN